MRGIRETNKLIVWPTAALVVYLLTLNPSVVYQLGMSEKETQRDSGIEGVGVCPLGSDLQRAVKDVG